MKWLVIMLTMFFLNPIQSDAQKSAVYVNKGAAINGYDAVAYFTEGKPLKGDKNYIFSWAGVDWYFINDQNLEVFKKQPEKYAPQFGGYCAYGVSEGHKAPTDPEAWTIVEGKLYLNYNKDVQKLWKQSQDEHIKKAIVNWAIIKDKD